MSRSPHNATFSNAVTPWPRINRARPQMRSVSSGLRLWGMADEPVCPCPKGSSTSCSSVRCRVRISVANFSNDAAIRPSVITKWACRSRCTTWFDTGSIWRPRRSPAFSSTDGGTVAWVPTAPEILPTRTLSNASTNLAR